MEHESDKIKEVEIEDSSFSFNKIYLKEYTPKDDLENIKKANILLIPNEGFREIEGYFFPECTGEVLDYLKDNEEDNNVKVDICISDEEYKKIELHSDVINIPTIIVQWIVFPTLTGMLATYLCDKIKNYISDSKKVNANVNIIVEKDGEAKKVTYDGSIENFERAMKTVSETIFK